MDSIEKNNYFSGAEKIEEVDNVIEEIRKIWKEKNLPSMSSVRERNIIDMINHLQKGEKAHVLLENEKIAVTRLDSGYDIKIEKA